jgi:predicted phage-related endonuclease
MSDVNKLNPIVSAGGVKRLYQCTLAAVHLSTNPFHAWRCDNTMRIKVNASNVASLIGKNPFKTREDALNEVLVDNGMVDEDVEAAELIEEIQSVCKAETDMVCGSKTQSELEANIKVYEQKVKEITQAKGQTDDSPVVLHALSLAVKERGTRIEEESTNKLEASTGISIHSRNAKCYIYSIPSTNIVIAGRTDGLQGEDTVVETKTRRRFWKSPPEYDIIQLRCYMKLSNRKVGVLNECFPDGSNRVTKIEWSDSVWSEIENKLTTYILSYSSK